MTSYPPQFREQTRITNNPEIQWHLKRIKKDEEEFVKDTMKLYKDNQRKRRIRRHKMMTDYKKKKLDEMKPAQRDEIIKTIKKRKEE